MTKTEVAWLIIGLFGQALFASRFLIQWIKSERERKSIIPVEFWYCSILGGITLFAYAIYKQDPVFIIGQAFGTFVYTRNLCLINQSKRAR